MFSIIADVSMHLIILLIILLISLSLIRISAHSVLMPMAQKAHHYCLSGLPQNSDFSSELAALVCAKNFTSLSASKIYITSGLIHLFVVSGSHLILIEKLIPQIHKNYSINRTFLFIVLLSYGLACELSPPISRCLIAAAINFYLLQINVKWPAHFKLLIAGITTLIFNYAWISSLSLQMSWIAAFVVMAGLHFYKNKHILFKQSLFFVALFPTIVFFQVPSLSVILINLILAPVLEFILFPLGLVVWFFNFLVPLFDFILIIFNFILKKCEIEFIIQTTALPRWLILANWLIIFMLHLAAHIIYVFNKQKMSKFNAC